MIIGFDLCSTVVDVTVNYKVLHALAVLIIRNDACFCYAGSQLCLGSGRDRQAVFRCLNRRSYERDDRQQHQRRKGHSDDTKHCFVFLHFSLSFVKKIFNHCPFSGQIITESQILIKQIGTAFVREYHQSVITGGALIEENKGEESS